MKKENMFGEEGDAKVNPAVVNGSDSDYPHTYLSTHTVYQVKIQFFHYFRGVWPYWKMDTGKRNFHEILLLF